MPSARLLWMKGKREGFMPSVLSVEFNGKCTPQPGATQAAKRAVGHSQDDPFVWPQKKSSAALSGALKQLYHGTAFGGLLSTISEGPHVLEN